MRFPITDPVLRWLEYQISDRLGSSWTLERISDGLTLSLRNASGMIIFDRLLSRFGEVVADLPCASWNGKEEGWDEAVGGLVPAPGESSLQAPLIERSGENHVIHYDIFGMTYWMLARIEEIGRYDLDRHGRFPATSSHAYKHGYLDRPVVDEWFHILRQVVLHQWPGLKLRAYQPRTFVTCDVDLPYQPNMRIREIAHGLMGDLIKRRSPKLAFENLLDRYHARGRAERADFHSDPYLANIDWMMDVNEKAGNRVAFYFITGHTHPRYDSHYRMDEPVIRTLLRRIHERGHEIGLHPSYKTYQSPGQMRQEADILRQTLETEGIPYADLGGRQHYLRWHMPQTARNWEAAGMAYDSTLAYADCSGFRCGTSREFTMFDALDDRALRIRQRPLVLMECSVIDECYMGLGYTEKAWQYMSTLRKRALYFGGTFTLLWHNSSFIMPEARSFYKKLIQA